MEITNLLLALQGRALWADARRVLAISGLEPAQGWSKTLSKYEGLEVDDEVAATLADLLQEHVLSAEKSLQFYRLSNAEHSTLIDALASARLPRSDAREAFPAIADLGDYSGINTSPAPLLKIDGEDGVFMVFASVREYEHREPIKVENLATDIQSALSDYSDVIGVKKIRHQAYDVLWLPEKGRTVVVAADAPKAAGVDFAALGHTAVRAYLRKACGKEVMPINLFGAIDKIYRSDLGKVVELGFTTQTASVKHERMRLQRLSLREETFHVGGRDAVSGAIDPFHISVDWSASDGGKIKWRPELTLHSSVRELHSVDPALYEAIFRHSLRIRDLRILKSKILKFA